MEDNKLKMQTKDFTSENIQKIGELFPNVIKEVKDGYAIDFEELKQELSKDIVEGKKERYQMTWPGKKEAILNANTPINKTLRPLRDKSVDFDNTKNIYIEGDNLEALKILQESYLEKIKCIYIDPPYNTGKDFVYKDNFYKKNKEELIAEGIIDEEGKILISELINTTANGKYHSDWLTMIYSRLKVAKSLLTDDGVIFISIDDNEFFNLKRICDEIFGEDNHLETFHIQVRYANKSLNEKDNFQKLIEYTLIYAKNKSRFTPKKPTEEYDVTKFNLDIKELKEPDKSIEINGRKVDVFLPNSYSIEKVEDSETKTYKFFKETWVTGSIYSGTGHGKVYQQVVEPRDKEDGYGVLYKIYGLGEDGLGFRYMTGPKQASANKGKMYNKIPLDKLEQLQSNGGYDKTKPIINFYDYSPDYGNIRHEGGIGFNSGKKPIKMLKQLLDMICGDDYTVLDFFSGSASTAHAVMQVNSEDNGNRKFVMVQLPENCEDNADLVREGFKTICDLGEERIRRAAAKIKEDTNADIDYGFRVYKVDDTNMKDVYYKPNEVDQMQLIGTESNIKEDRNDEDLLTQVILDLGIELDKKIECKNIGGTKVWVVDEGQLIACFEDDIKLSVVEEMTKIDPMCIKYVFKETCFANDSDKINVYEIIKKNLKKSEKDIQDEKLVYVL